MKKKFLSLLVGALAVTSLVHSQPPPTPTFGPSTGQVLFNGSAIVGPAATMYNGSGDPTSSTPLAFNTVFTYNGLTWGITPVPVPNLTPQINAAGNALTNFLNTYFLVPISSIPPGILAQLDPAQYVQINGTGPFYAQLANATGTLGVTPIPFDLGITAMLGAGALGAVRAARRRKRGEVSIA